jgi:hypothetical protein
VVLNTIYNNISVISWRSVLLMEETGVPRENHCGEKNTMVKEKLEKIHNIFAEK